MFHSSQGNVSRTLVIPAGAGSYAPEIIYLTSQDPDDRPRDVGGFDSVSELQIHVGTAVATVTVEVDVLKPGGDPATAGDWILAVASYTTEGLKDKLSFVGVPGFRIRGKSGGTGGNQIVSAWWF